MALFLTAIEEEADAVAAHLDDLGWEEHPAGSQYRAGYGHGPKTTWRIVIAETGRGSEDATASTARALDHLKPMVAFFVGVAGGLKDVGIGDVVAATEVFGFEYGKDEQDFHPRAQIALSTFYMKELAKRVRTERRWQQRIVGAAAQTPKAVLGPIAAGSKVVASAESPSARLLRRSFSQALAVEMEGLGFLRAVYQSPGIQALVVRGISDLLDGKAEADAGGSQLRAAGTAAAFAFELLSLYDAGRSDSPSSAQALETARESPAEGGLTSPDTGSSAGESARLVFVSHSRLVRPPEKLDAGDSVSKFTFRKQYLGDMLQDLTMRLRDGGYDVWAKQAGGDRPAEELDHYTNVGMLTSNAAVVLIDRDALTSSHVRRELSVLLWLRGFGLPVLPVALGDVTHQDIVKSPLGESTPLQHMEILSLAGGKRNAVARAGHVAKIVSAIESLPHHATSPTARWIQDMAHFLADVPDKRLPDLGDALGVPREGLAASPNPRDALAAALLGSDITQAYWCLRSAIGYLDAEARENVVARTAPIWVDLDTARLVLDAADLPIGHRVCGFETTALRLGDNIVKRATASAPEYATLRVPDVVGEDAGRELLERYDVSLRGALHLSKSHTPDRIAQQLSTYHAGVFVLIRCTDANPGVTTNLLYRLGQRFPGIVMVLLAEAGNPVWQAIPDAQRSSRGWTSEEEMDARQHVSRLYGLIGRDVPVDNDD
jgi:nucleoside phosphorylase